MSHIFGDIPPQQPAPPAREKSPRAMISTLITLAVAMVVISIFTSIWTEKLWFDSVDYLSVFTTLLGTRVGLFIAFFILTAAIIGANLLVAYRNRPIELGLRRNDPAARYRYALAPILKPVWFVASLGIAFLTAMTTSSRWPLFLQWRNGTPFGEKDPQFGKDLGFYVFDLPWWGFLTTWAFTILVFSLIGSVFVHYVFGGIQIRGKGFNFSKPARMHIGVLAGLLMVLQALRYWLERFEMMTGTSGIFDGVTYTDAHARIPSKNILVIVALVCAALFIASIFMRSWLLPGLGVALLVLSSLLIGTLWPLLMQRFQVDPSEPDREEPFLARNIEATRNGFDVADVETKAYTARTELTPQELSDSAESHVSSRLLDPTLVSPAFQQLQQVRGYYTVQRTLDVDRYKLGDSDRPQDIILAAREVDLDGLQASQRNWINDHTVYTHGYGVIAAYGNRRDAQGEPVWAAKDIPPIGELEFKTPPRVYFGEKSPSYSIVGRPAGAKPVEVDIPRGSGSGGADGKDDVTANTYDGKGGIPMGSLFRQSLYAIKFAEPKIILSDRVNENSKIIYDRHPRDRVKKVAPWLTLDGDTYPAVVDGRLVWIVDGYTTSKNYPYSEARSLARATDDTLTQGSAQIALPMDQVNYMRNSVKGVVDAYDGTVTLYEWDTEDPVLKTWRKAFPGVVKNKSEITKPLLEHLRYPTDLFKVQRDVLSRYHVTNPFTFYEDGERWKVPEDPTGTGGTAQPPYYLSMSRPGETDPKFSLTSVFLPNNRQNLASFISVNSEAADTEGFGSIQILQLPSDTQVGGPNQIAAKFQADRGVTQALLPFEQSKNAKILRGNLLTLPVGDGLLYVQPVYIQRSVEQGSYPVLQFIIASFGNEVGIGQTLDEALRVALGLDEPNLPTDPDAEPDDEPDTKPDKPTKPSDPAKTVSQYLDDANKYYDQAQKALRDGDLAQYQRKVDQMADALDKARKAQK